MKIFNHLAFIFFFLAVSVSSFAKKGDKRIYFYEIDDQVAVYVDGEKVYESDIVGQMGGKEIELDITNYVKSNNQEITIELFNVICNCAQANPWAISFAVINRDEELDFQNEKGEGNAGEVPVFTYTFTWDELL